MGERTLAFRADMDGLAIEEKTGLEFASKEKVLCMPAGMMDIWLFYGSGPVVISK